MFNRFVCRGIAGIILATTMSFLVSGCNNNDIPDTNEHATNDKDNNNISDNHNPKETDESKDIIDYNPLKFDKYTFFEDDQLTNSSKDIFVRAIVEENSTKKGLVNNVSLCGIKDNKAVVQYTYIQTNDVDNYEDDEYEVHFTCINLKDFSIVKDIVAGDNFGVFLCNCVGNLYCVTTSENATSIDLYDYDLNITSTINIDEATDVYFNSNMSRLYYCSSGVIKYIDVLTGISQQLSTTRYYEFKCIYGVLCTDDNVDRIVTSAMAVDTIEYNVIIDASTGETDKIFTEDLASIRSVKGNKVFYVNYGSSDECTYSILSFNPDKSGVKFRNISRFDYVYESVLYDGRILFLNLNGYTANLYLYDGKTLVAKSSIDIEGFRDYGEDFGNELTMESQIEGYEGLFVGGEAIQLGEGKDSQILLKLTSSNNVTYNLVWSPTQINDDIPDVFETSDFSMEFIEDSNIEEVKEIENYVPSKLSEKLIPLREKADELEKKYSIKIDIGEPCCNVIGGYAIAPLTDYIKVENALNVLEEQLEKYPKDFFKEFIYDGYKGLNIYLSSQIKGVSEETLDVAGGFQNVYNDYMIMVIDANSSYDLKVTFNHELSHSIEDKIWDKLSWNDDYCLDDFKWNQFNPTDSVHASCYTYTYEQFGYAEDLKYAYDYSYELTQDTYFVDSYSMTMPTEDRARLFEEVMTGRYGIDLDNAPKLQAKLNYYAKCIRMVFDSTNWENVEWERYCSSQN